MNKLTKCIKLDIRVDICDGEITCSNVCSVYAPLPDEFISKVKAVVVGACIEEINSGNNFEVNAR